MESTIHIQKMVVHDRRKLSHANGKRHRISHDPSFSISQIKKTLLKPHRHSYPVQHFLKKDAQSNDIIHTTIGTENVTINPPNKRLSVHNKILPLSSHNLSDFDHQNEQEKSINIQKTIKFANNKVEPIDGVVEIDPFTSLANKPSKSLLINYSSNEDLQRQTSSLPMNKRIDSLETTIDSQHQNNNTISASNGFDNSIDITEQTRLSISCEETIRNESIDETKLNTVRFSTPPIPSSAAPSRRRYRRAFLCAVLTPLIGFLIIATIVTILITFVKSKSVTTLETTLSIIDFTNGTVTASANTSTTTTIILTTVPMISTNTTATNMTSTATIASIVTTTESTTLTTTTTESTTTESTTTESTTTESTTTESTTTESTTTESTTTESTTSTTTTTESTTSTTTTTESTVTTSTTSTTTTSTTTTTRTTGTTTTASINPCSTGIYWNMTGIIYAGNGTTGSALNLLNQPAGLSIDSNDTLYVTDGANCRVLSYPKGATSGTLAAGTNCSGTGLNQFSTFPRYSCIDSNQNIYIGDAGNNRVMRWAIGGSAGVVVAGIGSSGALLNQTNFPYSAAVDSNFNVYVAEYTNQRVTKWALGASVGILVAGVTSLSGTIPSRLSSPAGLFFDETNQNLYITNAGSHTVMRWKIGNPNGTFVAGTSGTTGVTASLLNTPTGLTLDRWQNIYVNDRANGRIQLFCNGTTTGITIAGRTASGTNFSNPYDIRLDSQLNLYVADYGANRVIKFNKL